MHSIKICIAALSLVTLIQCHSYVIEARKVIQGTFVGAPGYARGYVDPSLLTYDKQMTYLLPLSQRSTLTNEDLICKSTQSVGNQSEKYPYLQARAGDEIALRYRENGHISEPIPEKPTFGSVSVYGTGDSRDSDTLMNIHHIWNANNTGGDLRGRLLQRQSFDDGSCYENNDSELSAIRAIAGQPPHDEVDGTSLTCKVVMRIPEGLPTQAIYTLYWVWDWPSVGNSGGNGAILKEELYTTCIDIQIV